MTAVLIVLLLSIAGVAATLRWLRPRGPVSPRDQVEAFTRARAMTTRWSADPGTTPAPVQDFIRQQSREEQSPAAR